MKVLLTGGAGFIGHHVAKALWDVGAEVTFLERLSHSGNLNRLAEISATDFQSVPLVAKAGKVIWHDLRSPISKQLARQIGEQEYVFHLAALTHVDRSIEDPLSAVLDNVVATTNLMNWARLASPRKFFYFSTDEVFGPAPGSTLYKEWDRYNSGNPYSASKAGGEEMALAFHNTYGLPVVITHTMNVFGERQHPEKYIPGTIRKVLAGETVTVHSDKSKTRAGSRFYIHASDVAEAMLFLMDEGAPGEKYNVVGEQEVDNLVLAQKISAILERPLRYEMLDFHSSRPGHDLRYGLDGSRLAAMGWKPERSFDQMLEQTVQWYVENKQWL